MKKIMIILCILLLSFSGCSRKILIQKERVCTKQYEYPLGEEISIRVHPEDKEVAKARKIELTEGIRFLNQQVKDNNNLCKQGLKNVN